MDELLLLCASPKGEQSVSFECLKMLEDYIQKKKGTAALLCLQGAQEQELAERVLSCGRVVIAFPTLVAAPPAGLLRFLALLDERIAAGQPGRPKVYLIVHGGALEAKEQDTAVALVRGFCRRTGLCDRVALQIGSGDLILGTPFRGLVNKELKLMARELCGGTELREEILVQMPLSPKAFGAAMQRHWKKLRQPQQTPPAQEKAGAPPRREKGAKGLFPKKKRVGEQDGPMDGERPPAREEENP